MAQYPYMIAFADSEQLYRHVVRANDSTQAVRRAARKHREQYGGEPPTGPKGEPVRVMNLTPKQHQGRFLPRIDGTVVGEAQDTDGAAVAVSLAWLDNRRSGRV